MPAFTVTVGVICQSSARNTLKSLKRNRLSVTPNCVSASRASPRSSIVKFSNFSNSVACSSGRFVSNSLRRNSPPMRSACVPRDQVSVSLTVHVRWRRLLYESFGPPKEKRSMIVPGAPM